MVAPSRSTVATPVSVRNASTGRFTRARAVRARAVLAPGPAFTWPLLGDTLKYVGNWQKYFDEMKATHGQVFRTSLFGSPTTVVVDVPIAKELIAKHENVNMIGKPQPIMASKFVFSKDLSGTQNLTSQSRSSNFKANTWMEAFGPRHMPDFTPTILSMFRDKFDEAAGQEQANLHDIFHFLTLKTVWARMIGRIPDDATQLQPIIAAMSDFTKDLLSIPLPRLGQGETAMDRAKRILFGVTMKTVAEETEKYNAFKAGEYQPTDTQQQCLIWCLLKHCEETGVPATEQDWMSNVVGGFFAGHETTRWILSTMIYELHQHPEILEKVRSELCVLEKDYGPDFMGDRKALDKMEYTNAVFMESLRHGMTRMKYMKHISGFQLRLAKEDMTVGGFLFPKGESILIPMPYMAYKEMAFWLEGEEHDANFRPERFLEGDAMEGFMPFGYGPKACAGQALANAEGKVMLYLLTLGGFKITLEDPDEPWQVHGMTASPVGGKCAVTQTKVMAHQA